MLVPEHTWGCNTKIYFTNYVDYSVADFESTRNCPSRKFTERSWEEKREYLYEAQKALGTNYVYDVKEPDLEGFVEIPEFETNFEFSWQLYENKDYKARITARIESLKESKPGQFEPLLYMNVILGNCKWNRN